MNLNLGSKNTMKIKENSFKLILLSCFLMISIFLTYYFNYILKTDDVKNEKIARDKL